MHHTIMSPEVTTSIENRELSAIEARCRLKAEGARWAAERQRRLHDGHPFSVAIEPVDRRIIERAKQLGCFLWMCGPTRPQPGDLELFELLGAWFEVAADTVTLLRECDGQLHDEEHLFRQCLEVAAEAQSALRSSVMAIEAPPDDDQRAIYDWLRTAAADSHIFIERYLRADDPADPYGLTQIQNRLRGLGEACQDVLGRRRRRTRWLNRLRYHAGLIASGGGTEHDWNIVALVADEMVEDGVAPSNREIRGTILPIVDGVPQRDGLPWGFQLVLREIENYLARRAIPSHGEVDLPPTEETLAVRRFLRGTRLVIVGGDRRDHAQQALQDAFALEDLIWLESREHQSVERFKPYILHDKVKAVILLIRWSGHSFGSLKRFCARHGKLFVRLPGGYSPNQVASQISVRLSRQSRDTAMPSGESH